MKYPDREIPHPLAGLRRAHYYEIPEEQRERFLKLTPAQRLKWLDEARRFTLLAHGLNKRPHAA